jgi:gliding motility-associated-like protein
VAVALPDNGLLVINSDGTYNYTPNNGFSGTDTFRYRVCNDLNLCDTATVTIIVQLAEAPVAVDDNPDPIVKNTNISGNVLVNDSDPNNLPLTVDLPLVQLPTNGVVIVNPDGNYTYTPNVEYVGTDQFQYRVCNDAIPTQCDTATVTITVLGESSKITAYQAFSPNFDGLNDEWVVDRIEQYPDNVVKIFNRWGNLVWIGEPYNNSNIVWRGTSNQGIINFGTNDLPDGTYFYVIDLNDGSTEIFTGYIELKR